MSGTRLDRRRARPAAWLAAVALPVALGLAPARAQDPSPAPRRARPRASTRKPAVPDVYFLAGGDRVSGRTLSKGRRAFVVQTPYGRLALPRSRIARIVWADGREEVLQPGAPPVAALAPAPAAALVLAIGGRSFWYAWNRREAADPRLRLQLWLDERDLATYVDAALDPQDLPGATINSFSFDPGSVVVAAAPGVAAQPPETRPGRVTLRLGIPVAAAAGAAPGAGATSRPRRLRLAYQVNEGTREEPAWRDEASTALDVVLDPTATAVVEVAQDAGRMEFSGFIRKRMKHVDSFRLEAQVVSGAAVPEDPPDTPGPAGPGPP